MTEEAVQHSPVADQGAFVRALGFSPDIVTANSMTVEIGTDGIPVVGFRVQIKVPPATLGAAFFAATQGLGGGAAAESEPIEKPTAKKAPAKKTARPRPTRGQT